MLSGGTDPAEVADDTPPQGFVRPRTFASEPTESLDHDEGGPNYGRGTGEVRPTSQGHPWGSSEASVTEGTG